MCLLNINHPCHNTEPHLFCRLNQSSPLAAICDKEFGKTCNNVKFIKKIYQTYFGFMNIILLHSDHWHVLATHLAIFRVVRARIQIYL